MAGLTWSDVPAVAMAVAALVLLEGLLSADNALVLAVMVRHLPKSQQKRALRYGIWGAFLFRAIAVVFAYQVIQFWQIKLLGGLYLFYLAVKHFLTGSRSGGAGVSEAGTDFAVESPRPLNLGNGFWATVISVELADIAFSIDSILAAVAMVEGLPPQLQENRAVALTIIYVGGVLGIIMMRLVAGVFLILLEHHHGLAGGAYVLVGWIGLKLIGSGIFSGFHPTSYQLWHEFLPVFTCGMGDVVSRVQPFLDWRDQFPSWVRFFPWEMPDWFFWTGMAVIVVGSLLYRPRKATRQELNQHELDAGDTLVGPPK
jgi:YkoY family integral membrane protein